ncbi:MAG: MBOAT family protein [Nitrospirae bacterium]|nr:MBOAT family protein [Nitrospirota bacterium]
MLFNSYEYIFLFFPVSILFYFYLNRKRLIIASKTWLVFVSLFYFSWLNIAFLPLLLISIMFNYAVGTGITRYVTEHRDDKKKLLVIIGITGNMLLLIYFKYMDFFIMNVNYLMKSNFELMHIVLPLGISFFTFTQIAYLVDSYRGEVKEYDLLNYSLFVTFFPHLLAGPIIHHKEMMPQFNMKRTKILNYENLSKGIYLFAIGLFKKVLIADVFASWVGKGFEHSNDLHFISAWFTSLSYTFQIYFDFSGYTDMALGAGLMFNIKLPYNFDSPYKSTDIREYWRRWHMTLSRFLRDYVYIPLGGNRQKEYRIYLNLIVTFLLGGLWHGAGWTFVLWGLLHGVAMSVHRLWTMTNIKLNKVVAWFVTFNFINITWVFFRASSIDVAMNIIQGMVGMKGFVLPMSLACKLSVLKNLGVIFVDDWLLYLRETTMRVLSYIIVSFIIVVIFKNSNSMIEKFRPTYQTAFFTIVLAIVGIFHLSQVTEFIYFNF